MEYFLNAGIIGGIFAVPNAVVDNYIKLANESAIKVLLYVLRNANETLSSSGIANALNISENQVEEAFVFWENRNFVKRSSFLAYLHNPKFYPNFTSHFVVTLHTKTNFLLL